MPAPADQSPISPSLNTAAVVIQLTLMGLANMLISTGGYEFICSQNPHSMKGLLLGLFYAMRGFYQSLAIGLQILFSKVHIHHPSSEFYYYIVNMVIGLAAVLVYVWVAKRYRYRVRDEPCNIHRYAEEYYSNTQQERDYDYSYSQDN